MSWECGRDLQQELLVLKERKGQQEQQENKVLKELRG
jgi:hypothetical protein